ncbi:hypothetical protein [Ichthyobacterium seriolicida]|uniref:ATP synthase subunit c n=1 Tax=Ichthyobacterium seriolicida TaxID=242600 RepID=A0A1J1DZ22_9FLAO|nr:hypothetical protein [Ichthyobacterium seriolicida]BAV95167.1 ATP synthase F0 subunit C [Ichthyobacterium seriolicida]
MEATGLIYLGIGLVVVGVGLGIGRIGSAAMDAIARQPDAADKIQASMLIAAGLIEGAGLIAIIFGAFIK